MAEDNDQKNLTLLYAENSKVAVEFWEWRHKILTRFFTGSAGMAVMDAWFYERPQLKKWVFVSCLLGFGFSLISDFMDRVNTKVLRQCYRIGAAIEQQWISEGGIYKGIQDVHYSRTSYHRILRWMYPGTALLWLLAAIFTAIFLR